jgi:hypothetical protein
MYLTVEEKTATEPYKQETDCLPDCITANLTNVGLGEGKTGLHELWAFSRVILHLKIKRRVGE